LLNRDLKAVARELFPDAPDAPRKPVRGEKEPVEGLEAVARELFLVVPRAPRKPSAERVQYHVNKCGACRRLEL
jgi:hypothetical protein